MGFFTGISNKFISGQYRIILSADTASEVRQLLSQSSKPKQGQRSQSARGFCPRSTMRVPQPDIIEHFGNADAVPQLPERCLSRKAGIVRCCLREIPTVLSIAGLIIVLIALAMLVLSDKKQEVVEE